MSDSGIEVKAIASVHPTNSSFSLALPGLQWAIDSTSLGLFKECPRKYYYQLVLGLRPRGTSVHLEFGIWIHGGRERYDHARAAGALHQEALELSLQWVLEQTWNRELGRPWLPQDSGRRSNKNRLTLIRSLVWYLDEVAQHDPIETLRFASGKPAVELSFSIPLGAEAPDGAEYMYCGHIDRIGLLGDEPVISDIKTTESSLDGWWFEKFSPDTQFTGYIFAGRTAFAQPLTKLIVDGVQVLAQGTRFQRAPVSRSEAQIEEWHGALVGFWLPQMAQCAEAGVGSAEPVDAWPQNERSCGNYGGCAFRGACSRSGSARKLALREGFRREIWDPLQRRGDI